MHLRDALVIEAATIQVVSMRWIMVAMSVTLDTTVFTFQFIVTWHEREKFSTRSFKVHRVINACDVISLAQVTTSE